MNEDITRNELGEYTEDHHSRTSVQRIPLGPFDKLWNTLSQYLLRDSTVGVLQYKYVLLLLGIGMWIAKH